VRTVVYYYIEAYISERRVEKALLCGISNKYLNRIAKLQQSALLVNVYAWTIKRSGKDL